MPLGNELTDKEVDSDLETYRSFQERVVGTNINQITLLSTDYLNHFNGFMMALEMLSSAPDIMAEEVVDWVPLTYAEHFARSGFRDAELAVEAYVHAPDQFKFPFDDVVSELNDATNALKEAAKVALEANDLEAVSDIAMAGVPDMRSAIDRAASIINGVIAGGADLSQDDVDSLFD